MKFKKVIKNKNPIDLFLSYSNFITIIIIAVWIMIAKFRYIGYSIGRIDFLESMFMLLIISIVSGIYFIKKSYNQRKVYWVKWVKDHNKGMR